MRAIIWNFADELHFDAIESICKEIASKDDTFVFEAFREQGQIHLIGENKDVLIKKACWIVYKADYKQKLVFRVVNE